MDSALITRREALALGFASYSDWLIQGNDIPKLLIRADPGALLASSTSLELVRRARNQSEVTVYGRHFLQEVSPDAIGRALARWLSTL